MIYEVAGYGSYGTVKEVEKIKIYEFMYYLAFRRTLNDK